MFTSSINNIKDNWEDSSESEQEQEEETPVLDIVANDKETKETKEHIDDEEWDFYEGQTVCINCSKSSEPRIIMIKSKRIFCYDACLDNYDDDYYDDDNYNDDYNDLDDYDKKLGLSVSCKRTH